jgi:hypothetical protein
MPDAGVTDGQQFKMRYITCIYNNIIARCMGTDNIVLSN